MVKYVSLLIVAGMMVIAASAQAADIAWVSFHSDPTGLPDADAAGAGFTEAPDIGYTNLLTAAGHTVTRHLTQNVDDAPTAAALAATYNSYDLVIISRSVDSGNYDNSFEYGMWNEAITAPVLDMSGYTLRNSRLGFTSGTTMVDTAGDIRLQALDTGHPIFSGISLDGSDITVDIFAGVNSPQRGISVNTDPVNGGGSVLATVSAAGDPADGGMIIGEWAIGSELVCDGTSTYTVGPRMIFLSGSREQDGVNSHTAGVIDLTATGESLFLNTVAYMAIPEPTTIAFFVLGGLTLIRRRQYA